MLSWDIRKQFLSVLLFLPQADGPCCDLVVMPVVGCDGSGL